MVYEGLRLETRTVALVASFTVCASAGDVLGFRFVPPEYIATMECEPATRLETVMEAAPPVRPATPKVLAPSMNVTEPVGVPLALVTTAVNVTAWP